MKTKAGAISSGCAARFIAVCDPNSATCTPSRYAVLTGEYAWRVKGTGGLPGDALLLIEPGRTTLPSMLKQVGYRTGVVGKWHLGLGTGSIDWNGEIKPGPLEIGFDYAFIMPATGDRVPFAATRHAMLGTIAQYASEIWEAAPCPVS